MAPNMDDLTVAFNVVVVEDDPLTRLAVELVFVDDEDFRLCWHAGSLSRALELAAEETRDIDLVVLDDVLQGVPSGAELAPLLKHLWPAARVVLFSADPDARRVTPCVDAAVRKTEPELLLARSRALLGLPRPASPSAPVPAPA
ncbi:MAG: response regulator, partial [Actinomycetota bacterium]|nr:response regulator [Actinomycetota bacterium]